MNKVAGLVILLLFPVLLFSQRDAQKDTTKAAKRASTSNKPFFEKDSIEAKRRTNKPFFEKDSIENMLRTNKPHFEKDSLIQIKPKNAKTEKRNSKD